MEPWTRGSIESVHGSWPKVFRNACTVNTIEGVVMESVSIFYDVNIVVANQTLHECLDFHIDKIFHQNSL